MNNSRVLFFTLINSNMGDVVFVTSAEERARSGRGRRGRETEERAPFVRGVGRSQS